MRSGLTEFHAKKQRFVDNLQFANAFLGTIALVSDGGRVYLSHSLYTMI